MSHCLSYYCDRPQTQALCNRFGDRLQKLSKSDLIDFQTCICGALNTSNPATMFDEDELIGLSDAMNIDCTEDFGFAIELIAGLEAGYGPALNLGLAEMIYSR